MFPATLLTLLSLTALLANAAIHTSGHGTSRSRRRLAPALGLSASHPAKKCKVQPVHQPVSVVSKPMAKSSSSVSSHSTSSTSTTSTAPTTSVSPPSSPQPGNPKPGIIQVTSPQCGASGGTTQVTATDGPNGRLLWLNCGVDGAGWNPPFIRASDLITQDLTTALKNPNSPFQACAPFLDLFNKYANINGIPPILATSISMQESGCNPSTVGGAGEQGLMQITQDKCGGAPNNNCKDPDFNIRAGLAYFKSTLDANAGNILLTMGQYNGWDVGMTIATATAAAHTSCCRCQNNLDYMQQVMNGWLQNLDPYALNLGLYFNLNKCN